MPDYEGMTREERVALLLKDSQAYMDIIPGDQGYWYQILDGIAKVGGIKLEDLGISE